ncbi:MAG: phosphatidylserine decarboxylase [Alphaproteobacteria bacterium]|nr:phosphatidylserine decarboxylase [Alphaproteobacteria bacterium]
MNSLEQGVPTPTVKYRMPAVHPEGIKFVVIAAALTIFAGPIMDWHTVGWLLAGLTIWVAAFFRDPVRATPQGAGLVVSPADGLVCQIASVEVPRQLEGALAPGTYTRVSVFMSVFDVHINRSPIAGTVSRVVYVPGKFLNADLDKASEDNERQYFVVTGADGTAIGFTQIAGLVARRIMRFVKEGDTVAAGQRIGLIRFGSRVDVYLPAGTAPTVALGQRTIAGETVLGRLGETNAAVGVMQ